jgi:hypothetical protein
MTRTILTCSAAVGLAWLAASLSACRTSRVPTADVAVTPRVEREHADRADADVRRLASADFGTRARATRRLVAGGEASLPALGRAGDLPVSVAGGMRVSATRAVVETILADLPRDAVDRALAAPWPNVRRAAAAEHGRRDKWSAIPQLMASLDDDDPEVRRAAAAALRRMTNHFFGFRAEARAGHRRAATDRWRTWWSREGRARAEERERGPSADLR